MSKVIFQNPCNTRSTARNAVKRLETLKNDMISVKIIDNGKDKRSFDRWAFGVSLLTETLKLTRKPAPRHRFTLFRVKHNAREQRAYNQLQKRENHQVSVIVKPSRRL